MVTDPEPYSRSSAGEVRGVSAASSTDSRAQLEYAQARAFATAGLKAEVLAQTPEADVRMAQARMRTRVHTG